MRCNRIRENIDDYWQGGEEAEFRQHLAQCPACAEYYRDLRLVRAGLHLLKHEEGQEPSLGFAERLVRQLGEMGKAPSVADFFERVGRRFVYATLVLTFLALLALAVPSTGPVRGLTASDIQTSSVQEASLGYTDLLSESGLQGPSDVAPAETPQPSVTNEVK